MERPVLGGEALTLLSKVPTGRLVDAHAQLNQAIDSPGPEVRRLQTVTAVPRPGFEYKGQSFSRAAIKDELVARAYRGDGEALAYATRRDWPVRAMPAASGTLSVRCAA